MIIKTNWENWSGEINENNDFNIANYNRIKNNIVELHRVAIELFPKFNIVEIADLNFSSFYFKEDVNNIENNLQILANNIGIEIEPTKHFNDNQLIWDAEDINRIERTVLLIKTTLEEIKNRAYRYSGTFYSGEDWGLIRGLEDTSILYVKRNGKQVMRNGKKITRRRK